MTAAKLEKEYQSILPLCESFANELVRQFNELFSQEGKISSDFIFQHRIKTLQSIQKAIQNKTLEVKSVRDFEDLIGLRIILAFKQDVDSVCALIRDRFKILAEKDNQAKLGEKEFGYASIHFIIEPPESWLDIPTFKKSRGFRAEVQVRTGAQHIWASTSHILQYKREKDVPPPVRRAISRVAALLEIVDLEFTRVLEERKQYRSKVKITAVENLNVDLLEKILDEELPAANKYENEEYALLVQQLNIINITKSAELRKIINRHRETILERDRQTAVTRGALHIPRYIQEHIDQGAYYSQVGLVRMAMKLEFGEKWSNKVGST